MNNSVKFLDCTLRDGGYYNNWNFNKKFTNQYLQTINKTQIKYVELGFRTLDYRKIKGNTAYTNEAFINSLKIPNDIKIGVMINGADFLQTNLNQKNACKKLFPNLKKSKVTFVRLACHVSETFAITNAIKWLKKNKFIVTVNLMQISEIKKFQIKKVCKLLKDLKVDILYLADSLGSLKPKETSKIINSFKKYWNGQLGIHAHNNMNLALENSIEANKNGVKWIDSTISGMGRGPGNVRTEDLIRYFLKKKNKFIDLNPLNNLIKKNFLPLKVKYKWGPNKYYNMSGKYKIHPTYIQEILSDNRYKKVNYLKIIQNLKKSDTKKYNPNKLLTPKNIFIGKSKGKWRPHKLINKKNVLIVGPGKSVLQKKKFIEKFAFKNKLYVICLNTVNNIDDSLVNLRVACHPLRILSDAFFHSKSKKDLAMPASMLPNKIYNSIKKREKKIFDFGLSIKSNNSIVIKDNHCVLPKPLAIGYSIAIAISGKAKKIFLVGFDGYKADDPLNDETNQILSILKKKYGNKLLTSLTPTKYEIEHKAIISN